MVLPTEGNEGRREGPQGVGAAHSTVEAGTLTPWGPRGGKGTLGHGTVGGKHGGDTELHHRVHATTTDSGAAQAIAPTQRLVRFDVANP
jgi:hypothetical protein